MSAATGTGPSAAPIADPRPVIVRESDEFRLEGVRCRTGHALQARFRRCPRCGADVAPERFGPGGTVWSFVVMHVGSAPEDPVPYTLAYLDLDDGPRTLVRIEGEVPEVGDRALLIAPSESGDAHAEVAR